MEAETDDAIANRLRDVPDVVWRRCWLAIAAVEQGNHETEAQWFADEQTEPVTVGGVERAVVPMPFVHLSDAVAEMIAALYEVGVVLTWFDWHSWQGGRDVRAPDDLRDATVAELCRFLTWAIRGDRFTSGLIAGKLRDGTLRAAVAGLRDWSQRELRAT